MEHERYGQSAVEIRNATIDDIAGIAALIGECGPYLSKHIPYQYFVYTHCFHETCLVAVENGRIIGWCSTLRVARRQYFMHQLGVLPEARGKHVAFQLFAEILHILRARHGDEFRLELTADRKNLAVHHLSRKVAAIFRMELRKLPKVLPQFENGVEEELYEMAPLRELDALVVNAAAIAA